jgi:predicted nucleotidyltransferase
MIRPEEEGMDDPAEKLVADVRAGMQQLEDGMASRFDEGVADRIKRQGRERLRTDTRLPMWITERSPAIRLLCERYGVRELALFGSSLRRDFNPASSDIDLAVVFAALPGEALADQYFGFKEKFEELMGRPVDLVEIESMPETRLKRIIERSKVPIYAAG